LNPEIFKKLRLKKGYTLADMCQMTGYTASFLSQLERGLKKPSLNSLRKIAECLEVPIIFFFMEDNNIHSSENSTDNRCVVIHKNSRDKLVLPGITAEYELLTPNSMDSKVKPEIIGLYYKLDLGCWSSEKMITHKADESIIVLKGKVKVYAGDSVYELEEGDSILIKKNTPHNILNCGEEISVNLSYTKNDYFL
jgi:transcriptional regulator with XRE-family HTH domain